jgi:hypothetical protein
MWDTRLVCVDCNNIQAFGSTRFVSQTRHAEYDCKEERVRNIYAIGSAYPNLGNNLEEKTVDSVSGPSEWQPVSAGSVEETLWKVACGKR